MDEPSNSSVLVQSRRLNQASAYQSGGGGDCHHVAVVGLQHVWQEGLQGPKVGNRVDLTGVKQTKESGW